MEFQEATAEDHFQGNGFGWRIGQRFAESLERWWFHRRVRLLAALSEGSQADLRRHYPGMTVAVVPRGIDLQRFRPDAGVRDQVRQEQGITKTAVITIFVDQDHRQYKGLETAIEGFAAASRVAGGPTLLWVLGEKNERCRSLAEKLNVGDRVRFLGYRPDPERLYQAADIFMLPTAYETLCRSAHEAAACGLPIVAPPVNGIRELIGADEAGIIAARDPEEVARALVRLAVDSELRAAKGKAAMQRATEFEQEAVARQLLGLHESLLARRQTPTGQRSFANTVTARS
jgi:UDP-glucose:(heptosyl)LPS alpha-1,3-glucosyltransferase